MTKSSNVGNSNKPILIAFSTGSEHTFVGRLPDGETREGYDKKISEAMAPRTVIEIKDDHWETKEEAGKTIVFYDVKPVGMQQRSVPADPNNPQAGAQVFNVPAFGTFHWCKLESVKKMYVPTLVWYYWVDDLSQASQDNFHQAWEHFEKELSQAREFERLMQSNLAVSTPADLKRMEETAKKMGLRPGPDLIKAMQQGR